MAVEIVKGESSLPGFINLTCYWWPLMTEADKQVMWMRKTAESTVPLLSVNYTSEGINVDIMEEDKVIKHLNLLSNNILSYQLPELVE